jgi:hypothetical protein
MVPTRWSKHPCAALGLLRMWGRGSETLSRTPIPLDRGRAGSWAMKRKFNAMATATEANDAEFPCTLYSYTLLVVACARRLTLPQHPPHSLPNRTSRSYRRKRTRRRCRALALGAPIVCPHRRQGAECPAGELRCDHEPHAARRCQWILRERRCGCQCYEGFGCRRPVRSCHGGSRGGARAGRSEELRDAPNVKGTWLYVVGQLRRNESMIEGWRIPRLTRLLRMSSCKRVCCYMKKVYQDGSPFQPHGLQTQ